MVFFIFIFSISLVFAAVPSYQDKYVNDFAGVFSSLQVGELRGLLSSVDADTTAEFVVVTDNECTSKGGPSQYAIDILNTWKVGKADKNNGLVALYCKAENKIWVSVGYGLEGILPDSKIGRMLDESYIPLRDSGNVSEGIISFIRSVSDVAEQNKEEILSGQAGGSSSSGSFGGAIFVIALFILFAFFLYSVSKRKGKKGFGDFLAFFFIDFVVRMILYSILFGGRNRSSGGGFGGGFGGGMGGGGGAGR